MADAKVSALTALTGANVALTDLLYIVDVSATTAGSKSITAAEFFKQPTITMTGSVIVSSTNGIDVNPGSDADADLITVGVTGAPKLWWDESEDGFVLNKHIQITTKITTPPYSASFGNFQVFSGAASLYGTAGTLTGVTADTTSGSTSVTLSAGHGITDGKYVTIGSMAGAFVLSSVGATSATLNRNATASLTGAAVQYIQLPDPEVVFGYNLNRVSNATEPEFVLKLETNYLDDDGYTKLELYFQYQSVGGVLARPIFSSINKTTERIQDVVLSCGTGGLQVYGGVGDGATDSYLLRCHYASSEARLLVGDAASLPAGVTERRLTVLGNSVADLALSTYSKNLVQLAALDGGGSPYAQLYCYQYNTNGGLPLYINQYGGNVSIGMTGPTAVLHLKAGTAAASTAPFKLTSGTVNSTAEAGAVEYNNTFHVTNSDATRRHVVTAPNTTKVTASAPYTNDGYVVVNIGGTDFKIMTTA